MIDSMGLRISSGLYGAWGCARVLQGFRFQTVFRVNLEAHTLALF